MVADLNRLQSQLEAFDELAQNEMKERYGEAVKSIDHHLAEFGESNRLGLARALVVAHGFAARYYMAFGEPVNTDAFPGDVQTGDGPAYRGNFIGHSSSLQNLEDELFEFLADRYPSLRQEFLKLLEEGWIAAVLEPSRAE
ncbi:hypothetical protein [Neorhizobium alkalisoli]|jgi:hypothetical protein|uniref:Uncharacterized protein n=1 Tax=Neorhizobium alkalisoli TaxID=528178 RepID=A0A561R6I7_9HYPH|nr:hypothetical protein [Neorhizobium alkalisoli]TWF58220.1 hypothetical protein FHW37_10123 [Neorhizobium alkalisoli]